MRSVVLLVVTSGLALGAPARKEDAAKGDLKNIQGTWKVEIAKHGGESAPADYIKNMRVVFSGNKIIIKVTIKDSRHTDEATFEIHPGKKPKAIEIIPQKGKAGSRPVRGIYQLDGDTLKMCWVKGDKIERPKEFAAPVSTPYTLMVLKREKE